MSKNKLFYLFLIPFLVVATLAYFRFRTPKDIGEIITAENAEKLNGLPNPAAQNCLDKGGKLEYLQETAGTLGICQFDDGSECEEWQFFREECEKGQYQKADTTHPYRGFISKSGENFTFTTESGQEYALLLTEGASGELKDRLVSEAQVKDLVAILASETPPLSKTLILKGFQEK